MSINYMTSTQIYKSGRVGNTAPERDFRIRMHFVLQWHCTLVLILTEIERSLAAVVRHSKPHA